MKQYIYIQWFMLMGLLALFIIYSSAAANAQSGGSADGNVSYTWRVNETTELVRVSLNKVASLKLSHPVKNVVVANPEIADVIIPEGEQRSHVYILARKVGATSIIFEGDGNQVILHGDIQVDVDVAGIVAALGALMPDDKIEVSSQRNGVFLTGFVRSASASKQAVDIAKRFVPDALDIINNLEVLGSRQVVMQVRVAEIKRTAIKQLGFDFNQSLSLGAHSVGMSVGSAPHLEAARTAAGVAGAFASGTIIPAIAGFSNIAYQVLEENGLAKTLAEPALTAITGETASFLAGGTFPMVSGLDTNGNKSYTQQPFGIRLRFTPTVMNKGQISLRVATEVSDRDTSIAVDGIPGLKMNRTETTVDLPSGGSLIIAGLIQDELVNTIDGVPGLKNLPVLGALFRSQAFRNKETELIVTITAFLAEPVGNEARMALPTDGFVSAGDIDLHLLGRLHAEYTGKPLPPYATLLTGPYGYIME